MCTTTTRSVTVTQTGKTDKEIISTPTLPLRLPSRTLKKSSPDLLCVAFSPPPPPRPPQFTSQTNPDEYLDGGGATTGEGVGQASGMDIDDQHGAAEEASASAAVEEEAFSSGVQGDTDDLDAVLRSKDEEIAVRCFFVVVVCALLSAPVLSFL